MSNLETVYVVVGRHNGNPNPKAIRSNTGRNGGDDNYTYKTISGANRRMAASLSESIYTDISVFEVKIDRSFEDESSAAERAERAAKRWGFI